MAESRTMRTPLAVTIGVWYALFLREAITRVSRQRIAWLWILLEPVAHIVFLVVLMMTIRMRVIGGIDTALWLMVGLLSFFMFRRPAQQAANAIGSNPVVFSYRQVKAVDTLLVRGVLEGFIMIVISIVLFGITGLYGLVDFPKDPLGVLAAAFGLWLCGLGFLLVVSVIGELLPELGRLIAMVLQPLYLLSGVMLPIHVIPPPYREWLMINPLAHGLEIARSGFAPHYHQIPETSLAYLYVWAVVGVFFGLAMHRYFAKRLAEQ